MAGKDRGTPPDLRLDLKLALLKEGSSFSFFQAIRLLRQYLAYDNIPEPASNRYIEIKPLLSLAFPPADVERIEENQDEGAQRYSIIANFFGLYGVSSPLPTFYTEDLIGEAGEDSTATREFIDILHQHLYHLLFAGWMKYRYFQQISEGNDPGYITRLFCLLGLGESNFREKIDSPEQLLRYLGLFWQSPRSALGLKTLLRDALGLPVDIFPCVTRKAKIPRDQRLQLGSGVAALGQDSFLGEEMDDRMGKFRIQVGPLEEREYRSFIPGSPLYKKLVELTSLFVPDPLEYDIDVIMADQQAHTTCLGGPRWSSLGHDTWIFSGATLGRTTSRFYPGGKATH